MRVKPGSLFCGKDITLVRTKDYGKHLDTKEVKQAGNRGYLLQNEKVEISASDLVLTGHRKLGVNYDGHVTRVEVPRNTYRVLVSSCHYEDQEGSGRIIHRVQ
jgi:hypothetical protein